MARMRVFVVLAQFGGEVRQAWRVERGQRGAHLGQHAQAVAQRGQVARPRAAQGDARQDALQVA